MSWNTIHIFWFGDVQIIGQNGKTKKAADLTKLQAVIDNVWSKKPQDNTSQKQYHAITIFNGMFCDWQPKLKDEKGFRTKFSELNSIIIKELADELEA